MNKLLTALLSLAVSVACRTEATDPVTPGGPASSNGENLKQITITTVAGTDTRKGYAEGKGTAAQFESPYRIVFDKFDNAYIIDQLRSYWGGTVIRKMDPAGNVTTFAKGFSSIEGICVDPRDGTTLYAVESGNALGSHNGLLRISSAGQVTRLSGGPDPNSSISFGHKDGPLSQAKFNTPRDLVMDKQGNLYVADPLNFCIRKVNLATQTVSTFVGGKSESQFCEAKDGKGTAARFCNIDDLTIDNEGNLYVPDWGNHSVRKVTPDGTVTTYLPLSTSPIAEGPRTGNGMGVYQPYQLEYDQVRNRLYVVTGTGSGMKVVAANDYVFSMGKRVMATDYADKSPGANHITQSLALNSKGELFTVDKYNHCIRKWTMSWQ